MMFLHGLLQVGGEIAGYVELGKRDVHLFLFKI